MPESHERKPCKKDLSTYQTGSAINQPDIIKNMIFVQITNLLKV